MATAPAQTAIEGLTILLVEDESLLSMMAEDILMDAGCAVVLAMRLREALELARTSAIDLAVLDVNLGGGETSYPVAQALMERGIPFLFASGYDLNGLDPAFQGIPRIQKPYSAERLLHCVAATMEQDRGGR